MESFLSIKSPVIYELYIDKFSKNIPGLTEKLPYLKSLGVNAIWILPHYPSPMVDGGYDVTDYKDVCPELGTLSDFEQMIKTAHQQDIYVFIDLVMNHTSSDHPWFCEARSNLKNPKRNYYIWSKSGTELLSSVNAFPNVKLTNWVYNPFTNDHYFATFYPLQPDLNWDEPMVLEEFKGIISHWVKLGADGFRLDAVTHLIKRPNNISIALPETHVLVKTIRKYIDDTYNNIVLFAEADLPAFQAQSYFGNGNECHFCFNFESCVKLYRYFKNKAPETLKEIYSINSGTPPGCAWVNFLGSHDALPLHILGPEESDEISGWLAPAGKYARTHDKRVALRLSEVFKGNPLEIEFAFNTLFSIAGPKVIYYGDEIGMRNKISPDFLIDNRYEVRGEFDWDEVSKQDSDKDSILNRVKRVISEHGGKISI